MITETYILTYILAGIVLFLLILVVRLEMRFKKILHGKNSENLEDSLTVIGSGQKELEAFRDEVESYLRNVEKRLARSIQGIGTVRFNPFQAATGGNQSFATAFLNEKGDGVVISSIHARDRISIFSKSVQEYTSEHELTNEEKEAIEIAKKMIVS
ncbi:DUF4446 family protein [Patescibacteria group bacterium]|nr:DUF4446 family protein [Patescibacteria group bacterium]